MLDEGLDQDIDEAALLEERKQQIETFSDNFTSTDPFSIRCEKHVKDDEMPENCDDCNKCVEMVGTYQSHKHSFSCNKKNKFTTVNADEGHGTNDGKMYGSQLKNVPVCRHNFPKFPMDETRFLVAPPKDLDDKEVAKRKADLKKIKKFLIRQTHSESSLEESEGWKKLKEMSFLEFLQAVGMFVQMKPVSAYSELEVEIAKTRYFGALGMSIRGTGAVFQRRKPRDLFINAFNDVVLKLNQSNHDLQVVVDMYAVASYVCGYLTKNESGISKLLRTINEEHNGRQMDKLKAMGSALDKGREVSVQEACYRLRGDPMTKCSVKVKHLSTAHPHFREGLLKGNLEALEEGEQIFHTSPHQYYENRPNDEEEPVEDDPTYWENLCCADFRSNYEIVYGKQLKQSPSLIKLQNNKGYIRKRQNSACLRYYLNYDNSEDLCRGLLILFLPFRNEMVDIHQKDVIKLVEDNRALIDENQRKYEKFRLMTDLLNEIQRQNEKEDENDKDSADEEDVNVETTSPEDIQEFEKWAMSQASKELDRLSDLTDIPNVVELRKNISSLNYQQRRLFDDFCERVASSDVDEPPFYIFISGSAGTGKSFTLRCMIDAVKYLKLNSETELKKPSIVVGAPTATAAYVVGGRTLDSIFGFNPTDGNRYVPAEQSNLANMKFAYEDVKCYVIDEISMVGASKFCKINFRMQEMADGADKQKFMGGRNMVVSGIYIDVQLFRPMLMHCF